MNLKNSISTYFIIAALLIFTSPLKAQKKSYIISVKGDTINVVDHNGAKQGKWVVHVDPLRGEPGYEEEGEFVDGKKEGSWRKYNLQGDLVAVENFKKGDKEGRSQFFSPLGDLLRVENWRAYNPDQPYDTIAVYGQDNNQVISYKIVKAEPYSVKDGEWTYYEPGTGRIIKTEKYDRGHLLGQQNNTAATTEEPMKKIVPKEVLEFQKKNSHKKKVKVIDGSTHQ